MAIWPFSRKKPEKVSSEELRRLLIAAASGSKRNLRTWCNDYKDQIKANLKELTTVPVEMPNDQKVVQSYLECLHRVAQLLASECNAPELWNKLCGTPEDNPFLVWERWHKEFSQRFQQFEQEALIAEARELIEKAKTLSGQAVRRNEAMLYGRLGELLFHTGRVEEALNPFLDALKLCEDIGDVDGQIAYLGNLVEAQRYLGNVPYAIATCETLLGVLNRNQRESNDLVKRIKRLSDGEPLCRVVCCLGNVQMEVDEICNVEGKTLQVNFCRNRLPLRLATAFVEQGNALASEGQYADALTKYDQATGVDPYDPEPVYQGGECLLQLGLYAKAKEAFDEVEELAPGWFRCRSDRWLAESLEDGTVSDDEFRLLRVLEDGGLKPADAIKIAEDAVERFPDFAPIYLAMGDLKRDRQPNDAAIAAYRTGLELVAEPDVESRLLCALAAALPIESPERKDFLERALQLKGSLVAAAMAKLMLVQ